MDRNQLSQIFVLANEFKEGDLGIGGTRDDHVRREARGALAALSLGDIASADFVEDQVTEALHLSLDPQLAADVAHLTVAEFKRMLLSPQGANWIERHRNGVSSEAAAAVAKIMTNEELGALARRLFNPLPGKGIAIGAPGHFGSRVQPNSPGDDETEILLSILEGLTYGCGDVILGLNPASDDIDTIIRLEQLLQSIVERLRLPTRYCVLSDIVKQTNARAQTRVDVGFQSLAGTSKALWGMVGLDVDGLLALAPGFDGLYFETGQGSAVTNQAAAGVDMVTLEARAYGVARLIQQRTGRWMIVNDVAGFIGPEVFRTGAQLLRACLEDSVMAKLHGITMGLDVCATFHMGIGPAELRTLTEQIVAQAAPAYLMAVAGNADPMLGYLTTSFREHPRLRRQAGREMTSAMEQRLIELSAMTESGSVSGSGADSLYAAYQKAGGDTRSLDTLRDEGAKKIGALRERGFDLGYGCDENYGDPPVASARIAAIYANARLALYSMLDEAVVSDSSLRYFRAHTRSSDRDDYLAHPATGELINSEDAARIQALYPARRPQVQVVVSDGLNANAVNENLRSVLPGVRRELLAAGHHVGETDIVIQNGRVRAGYHVGSLLEAEMIIHLIGERPGTGSDTLSAYLTYGLDEQGQSRWAPGIDHSWTTAVCGIHRRGKPPQRAVEEIVRLVDRMFAERCSGVALQSARGAHSRPVS